MKMIKAWSLLCAICICSTIMGQSVSCVRSATLTGNSTYTLDGTALLETLEDGSSRFRLGEGFRASGGPDVRMYLSNNARNVTGGFELFELDDVNGQSHFSGALTLDLPSDVSIDDFAYVVTWCEAFGVLWGNGQFSTSTCNDNMMDSMEMEMDTMTMEMPVCLETIVATTNWADEVTICPFDGIADDVELRVNINVDLGQNFSFLITDTNNNLQAVVNDATYDFENSGLETQYVYGVYYQGGLNYQIDRPISEITATECSLLSNTSLFLTVIKEPCEPQFECLETTVATTNWVSEVSLCPSDGTNDVIPLLNNLFLETGDNYVYIITDSLRNIVEVITETEYNFEGSGMGTNFVFGASYSGNLDYTVGSSITTMTADSCFMLSDTERLLTIRKDVCEPDFECLETLTATTNWVSEVNICPTDGQADLIPLLNNLLLEPGDNYAYIITDNDRNIISVTTDVQYDFEGSGLETNLVFGISYSGTLDFTIGSNITTVTADDCFILSNTTIFLTILKDDCSNETTTRALTGRISSIDGRALTGIRIQFGDKQEVMTNSDGTFEINGLSTEDQIVLEPVNNENAGNGLSSLDLIVVRRHILGLEPFTDPIQFISADVNNSGSITASDLATMQRVLLNQSVDFRGQNSWIFVPASAQLTVDVLRDGVPQSITIAPGTDDEGDLNFIGIKVGDLNGSATIE